MQGISQNIRKCAWLVLQRAKSTAEYKKILKLLEEFPFIVYIIL